jgi:hypothetical protein
LRIGFTAASEFLVSLRRAGRDSCFRQCAGFRLPTGRKSNDCPFGVPDRLRLVEVAAEFTNANAGAQVNLTHPDLEVAIVALARIGSECCGFVANFRSLIDASTLG